MLKHFQEQMPFGLFVPESETAAARSHEGEAGDQDPRIIGRVFACTSCMSMKAGIPA